MCLLWARGDAQRYLYPLVIDGGGPGTPFERHFAYQGTSDDVTRYIALKVALTWREWLGERKILEHTHGLAAQACDYLSKLWGTRALDSSVQGNMCNVELPCRMACPAQLGFDLYHKYGFYMPVFGWAGSKWARLTCTVYNEMADIELVGSSVLEWLADNVASDQAAMDEARVQAVPVGAVGGEAERE